MNLTDDTTYLNVVSNVKKVYVVLPRNVKRGTVLRGFVVVIMVVVRVVYDKEV